MMKRLNVLCAVAAMLLSAGSAFALSAKLGSGGVILVGPSGSTIDLPVEIIREAGDPALQAVTMKFIADDTGLTIVGAVGGTTNNGTGTRYNDPEWDANTAGLALSPNAFSGPMPANTARGYYGSYYMGNGGAPMTIMSSTMGHLVISFPSFPCRAIRLTPTMVNGVDEYFNDVPGTGFGVTLQGCLDYETIITQWRSMRTHSTCGELPIVLDPAATGATGTKPTVETRGATPATQGVLEVQIDFDRPVTLLDTTKVLVTYRPTIQSPPSVDSPVSVTPSSVSMVDADTLSITFASGALPNLGCANIALLAGLLNESIIGDSDCNIRILAGDMNSSGTVTSADFLAITPEIAAGSVPTTPGKAKYDVNLNCTITLADKLATKAQVIPVTKTALCP